MKLTKSKLKQIIQEEKDWMQKAFGKNKGALHKELGVPEGEDISVTKMAKALRAGGKTEERARAAVNANPDKYGSIKDVGVDKKNESLLTKESLSEMIQEEFEKVVKEYGAPVFSPKEKESPYARRMPVAPKKDKRTELEKALSKKDKKLKEKDEGDFPFDKIDKDIEKRGTKGVCTGEKFGGPTCRPGTKRYNLAKTFREMNEVTAGAEKFADFEALAQAFRDNKTDRDAAQEIVSYVDLLVTPEMKNLGLVDTATRSAKGNGLFDWSAPRDDPYKNASIDLYDDGYEVEVYPSTDEDEKQETKAETLMDAINFIRGVLSPQGAVAPGPGEDPAQMEFPLQENRKIKIRRKKK